LSEQGDVLVLLLYNLFAEENQEVLTFDVIRQCLFYADVVGFFLKGHLLVRQFCT
jgi:hypothetical protein